MTASEAVGPPFAELVRARMAERGQGLRELCREAGLDASFFSKVLAGKRSPPAEEEVLRRLAGCLDVDPARLIVASGRIPGEWRGLWSDPGLFAAVDGLLRGPATERYREEVPPPRPWGRPPPPQALPRSRVLEDELL